MNLSFLIVDKSIIGSFLNNQERMVHGGGGGIRTHGPVKVSGFQDRCTRPLCDPSLPKTSAAR